MVKGLDTLKADAVKSDGRKVTRRLTLLFAVLALALPATAGAAPGMEIAIQDDGILVARHYYDRDKALAQVKDLGATRIRINLGWSAVLGSQAKRRHMPHRLRYNWRKYDDAVNAALFRGLRVQLTITGPAPRWATGNHRVGVYKVNASRYGAFARSAARHFGWRVDRYSIWNEPNYKGWLAPMKSAPRIYRGLFRAGWRGIKSVAPGAQVLIGETSPYAIRGRATAPLKFLRGVTCTDRHWRRHCPGLYADGYAHHPYDFKHRPEFRYPGADNVTIGTLYRMNFALAKLSFTHALRTRSNQPLPIYLTEFGYFQSGKYRIGAGRHAAYLRRGFKIAQDNGQVRSMLQYLLTSPPKPWDFFDTGILTRGGRPTAAYSALRGFAFFRR
jgi:hypothetical protein